MMEPSPVIAETRALIRAPLFSDELGIALARNTERECFKWFLASLLFGARISATIARNTIARSSRHGLVTPDAVLDAGWDYREGGYVRYDGRKSTQVLRDCQALVSEYGGRVKQLDAQSRSPAELEQRLLAFYGVSPITANIFLRELRRFWKNADPAPCPRCSRRPGSSASTSSDAAARPSHFAGWRRPPARRTPHTEGAVADPF